MTIKIDTQEKWIWMATNNGWEKLIGQVCSINDLKVTAAIQPDKNGNARLIIRDLASGLIIYKSYLTDFEMLFGSTKEKAMSIMEDKLKESEEIFKSENIDINDIKKRSDNFLKGYVSEFGPMPEIEKAEVTL